VPSRVPCSVPDDEFNEIFAKLPSHRDRALVAFYVSTGARASELLSATLAGVDPGRQLIGGAQGNPRISGVAGFHRRVRVVAAQSGGDGGADPQRAAAAAVVDVAVFNEDIVRHYAAFLDHRRELRPIEEYRGATSEEWAEFDEHFDKRKVGLGSCGRPCGTPCRHEHACIHCPMLHVNPKMLARLDELETDLLDRRTRAEAECWAGEVEGVDMTLTFLRAKREDTQRRLRRPAVDLGLPALPRATAQQERPQ
jgi:hypothetical protein